MYRSVVRLIAFSVPVLMLSILLLCLVSCRSSSESLPKVCITQIASHPSLDEVRKGIIDALNSAGFDDKKTVAIIFRNANGDPSLTLPIAQDFVRMKAAVIVPIATPSALAAAKSTDRIPIVFGGVTNPEAVGLVTNLERPSGNITGTSDRWPYDRQLEFFRKILPESKRIGILYTVGDDVAYAAVDGLKLHAADFGFTLKLQPVSSAADVYPSAVSMLREVDVIYAGMDNLIMDNLEAILKAANEAHKPVLSGDAQSVERGALATWAIGMYELGLETGDMVVQILRGAKVSDLPVRLVTRGKPVINSIQAKKFHISPGLLTEMGASLTGHKQ